MVLDEPLYRRWLEDYQDYVVRPYTMELISGTPHASSKPQDNYKWSREKKELNSRISSCVDRLDGDGVIFVKHMAKHCPLYDFEKDGEANGSTLTLGVDLHIKHKHVLLIRDPVSMLSSWDAASAVHSNSATPNEVGIVHLLSIYSNVKSRSSGNGSICVVDSDDLASDPDTTLGALCNDLDIPFTTQMLSWESGPHECDGPWADWWYSGVHESTGWSSDYARRYQTLDPSLLPAMRASLGAFNFLKQQTHRYINRGPKPETIYEDPRNEHVLVYIGAPGFGRLIPRDFAGVSPWDASVQGGDATWEGK